MPKSALWNGSTTQSLPIDADSYLKSDASDDLIHRVIQIAHAVCDTKVVSTWNYQTWSDFAVVALCTKSMEEDFPKVSVDDIRHYTTDRKRIEDAPHLDLNAKIRKTYKKRIKKLGNNHTIKKGGLLCRTGRA